MTNLFSRTESGVFTVAHMLSEGRIATRIMNGHIRGLSIVLRFIFRYVVCVLTGLPIDYVDVLMN